MPTNIRWYGPRAERVVHSVALEWVTKAAEEISDHARALLMTQGAPGARRSLPGEPPRRETGALSSSVRYEINEAKLTAWVGTDLPYGMWLEKGTKRGIAPRPWLRRAFAEVAPELQGILRSLGSRI